jgi:hypothetical protein
MKLSSRIIFCLVFGLMQSAAYSQTTELSKDPAFYTCSYYGGELTGNITTFRSSAEATGIIRQILSVIGLKQNFDIRSGDVPNAAAVIYKGKRLIIYNPEFIASINAATGTDWSGIGILAHEIGHHLNGHTLSSLGSRPDIELEADEFMGFVLRRMGASIREAQSAMNVAANVEESKTHPAKKDRLKAIAAGWNNADQQMAGTATPPKTNKEIRKPVITADPEKASPLAEKFIAFDIYFDADPSGKYYVTIRNNLVKVEGNELYIIGRLALTNIKGYKHMLYDKQFNYLYINSKGVIVNGKERKVGLLKPHNKV